MKLTWIKCSDKLPPLELNVLVTNGKSVWANVYRHSEYFNYSSRELTEKQIKKEKLASAYWAYWSCYYDDHVNFENKNITITHWAFYPKPPRAQKSARE